MHMVALIAASSTVGVPRVGIVRLPGGHLFFAQVWFWVVVICSVFVVGLWLLTRFVLFLRSENRTFQILCENLDSFVKGHKTWNEEADGVLLDAISKDSLQGKIV